MRNDRCDAMRCDAMRCDGKSDCETIPRPNRPTKAHLPAVPGGDAGDGKVDGNPFPDRVKSLALTS